MIYKTTSRPEFLSVLAKLKAKGYVQVVNAILPNWVAGTNYIEVSEGMGVFALCSEEKANRIGYEEYKLFKQ